MASKLIVACVGICMAGASCLQIEAARLSPLTQIGKREEGRGETAREVLNKYCITCHNSRLKTAGLALDSLDPARAGEHAEIWERVATKLRTREMPPPGRTRPDAATYAATTNAIESALDAAAAAKPNPGRVAVHRLNRAEYANAIRDLLGLEIDGRALLPAEDEAQEGFENVASVLSASPALIENYLSAARTVSRLAIGDPTLNPVVKSFNISKLTVQDEQMNDDLPFGSQGGALIRYHFPLDGEYSIKVLLRRQLYSYIVGMGEPHQLDIRLDGVRLKRFSVGGEAKGMTMPLTFAGNTQGDPEFEVYMQTADAGLEVRVPVTAGVHEVGVSFVRRFWEPEGFVQPTPTGFFKVTNENYHGNPAVEFVMIGGPYVSATSPLDQGSGRPERSRGTGDSLSRQKIFTCRPKDSASEQPCARTILTTLAAKAYRRPLTEDDVQTLMGFYHEGRAQGSFDEGIRRGIEWMLAAPSFLFRIEREPANTTAGSVYRLSDLELASRLSFFLWSSIPDEELIGWAARGKLKDPVVLDQQVRRMLRDSRSRALVDNFATRWLELSKLSGVVLDTDLYSEFDENLRDAMAQETTLFVADQLRDDRSVVDLLTADYTFLNDRLARHYGIPHIYGNHFRRVTVSDPNATAALGAPLYDGRRGGLLGQASILSVTSYSTRTSVVTRGKWVLANLLGAPPPPPPPDVPMLKEAGEEGQPRSMRERLEMHRRDPACASCHQRMDPIGFALEHFDADGTWRTMSDGVPVDASASLPDGTRFHGVAGLRSLLVSHKEDFARTLTAKLLAYAIGRGIEYSDLPAVRQIVRDAAVNDYRWSFIIAGIVNSTPFTMSTARGGEAPRVAEK